jgi:hypothetical protein
MSIATLGPNGYTVPSTDANPPIQPVLGGLGYTVIPLVNPPYPRTSGSGGGSSSPIQSVAHIPNLLAAMKSSNVSRVNIGWHGMSIDVGVGSDGTTVWKDTWSTTALPAVASQAINTARGGTFARGIETASSTDSGLAPFFTAVAPASINALYTTAVGACGQGVVLAGAGTAGLQFTVNAAAGQRIRVYGIVSGTGVGPRYSASGANTVAATALPVSVVDAVAGSSPYNWYNADIVLASAGSTTVTILAASTANTVVIYAVDPDVRVTPGLTIHRLAQQGHALGNLMAMSLDNTDATGPAGWISAGNAVKRQSQTDSVTQRVGLQGVIASFDINDHLTYTYFGYNWTLADHRRHADNYLAAMKTAGMEVLIYAGSLRNPSSASFSGIPYTQRDIMNAYRDACAASTNGAFLDNSRSFAGGSDQLTFAAQTTPNSGWLAAEAPDYIHPNAAMHTFYGNDIATAIQASW